MKTSFPVFFKDEERKKGRFIEGVGCNVQWAEIFPEGVLIELQKSFILL